MCRIPSFHRSERRRWPTLASKWWTSSKDAWSVKCNKPNFNHTWLCKMTTMKERKGTENYTSLNLCNLLLTCFGLMSVFPSESLRYFSSSGEMYGSSSGLSLTTVHHTAHQTRPRQPVTKQQTLRQDGTKSSFNTLSNSQPLTI